MFYVNRVIQNEMWNRQSHMLLSLNLLGEKSHLESFYFHVVFLMSCCLGLCPDFWFIFHTPLGKQVFSWIPSCAVSAILTQCLEVFDFHTGTVYFIRQTFHFISVYVFLCVSLSRRRSINQLYFDKKKNFFVWGAYSFRTAETLWRDRQAHFDMF